MTSTPIAAPRVRGPLISLAETADFLRSHDDFLVVSHLRPDGDCLGSTLGLMLGLRKLGKRVAAYNSSPIGAKWDFLAGISEVKNGPPTWTPKATVFVDCGGIRRVSDVFEPIGATLNIDHHRTNDCFAERNFIDIEACAVGEQVAALLKHLGVPLDEQIASALYVSVMTDTGSFRYNDTANAFVMAAEFVRAGAKPHVLAQAVWENRSRGEIVLSGIAYSRIKFEFGGKFCWTELRQADYAFNGGLEFEPEGLATEIRGIQGVEISCLLHETEEGWTRAGFRGKGDVDCSAIAQECGGGGHFNASGAMVRTGGYEGGKQRVLEAIRKAMNRQA